jgi:HEAT repeat protein
LLSLAQDSDPDVRFQAAYSAGRLDATGLLERLNAQISQGAEPPLQTAIADVLQWVKDSRAAALARVLAASSVVETRRAAILVLRKNPDRDAVLILFGALNDPEVCFDAALALREVDPTQFHTQFKSALTSEDSEIRHAAADALASREGSDCIPVLEEMLLSKAKEVHISAVWTLMSLQQARVVRALVAAHERGRASSRGRLLEVVDALLDRVVVVKELAAMLDTAGVQRRLTIAQLLRPLRNEPAAAQLLDRLSKDDDEDVRRTALDSQTSAAEIIREIGWRQVTTRPLKKVEKAQRQEHEQESAPPGWLSRVRRLFN